MAFDRSLLLAAMTLGLLGATSACKPKVNGTSSEIVHTAPSLPSQPVAKPVVQKPSPIPQAKIPLELLPPTTEFLIQAASVRQVLAHVDQQRIKELHPNSYQKIHENFIKAVGVNLFDIHQYSTTGIDVDRPIGFALLDVHSETGLVFAHLNDPQKFLTWVESWPNAKKEKFKRSEDNNVNNVVILRQDEEYRQVGIVLRDSFVFMILCEEPVNASVDAINEIARADPRFGLPASDGFRKATAELPLAKDISGFINAHQVFKRTIEDKEARLQREEAELDKQREELYRQSIPYEEIKEREQFLDEMRDSARRRRQEQEAIYHWMEQFVQPWSAISFAIAVGPTAIEGQAFAAMDQDDIYLRLFRNHPQIGHLFQAMTKPPWLLYAVSLDMSELWYIITDALQNRDISISEIDAQAQAFLGMDLSHDLWPVLGGRFGIALTPDRDVGQAKKAKHSQGFDTAMFIDIRDQAKVNALLQRISASSLLNMSFKPDIDGYQINSGGTPFYIAASADQFVSAFDLDTIKNVKNAKRGEGISQIPSASIVEQITSSELTAMAVFDAKILLLEEIDPFTLYKYDYFLSVDSLHEEVNYKFSDISQEALKKVRKSKDYLAKEKTYGKLLQEIEQVKQQHNERNKQIVYEIIQVMGLTTLQLQTRPNGLRMEADQWMGPGGLTAFFERSTALAEFQDSAKVEFQLLRERRELLRHELVHLRQQDLENYINKNFKPLDVR